MQNLAVQLSLVNRLKCDKSNFEIDYDSLTIAYDIDQSAKDMMKNS